MDITQAAFGLDMRAASRIYFINPVLNPQVEAQAIGRARRISQKKHVTVETLVLRGSLEEVIVSRRREMTQAEHRKCKSILDDRPIYDWILNARIAPLPEVDDEDSPAQMAPLQTPQYVFWRGSGQVAHPDEDLVMGDGYVASSRSLSAAENAVASVNGMHSLKRSHDLEPGVLRRDEASWKVGMAPQRPARRVRFTADSDED